MANVYFRVFDTTIPFTKVNSNFFGKVGYNNNLAGYVTGMAEDNGTDVKDIRLFVYPSKKEWDKAFTEWVLSLDNKEIINLKKLESNE